MSPSGIKTLIYDRDFFLGEAEVFPTKGSNAFRFPNNEIRISHLSLPSDRCHPLSVLHTISPFSFRCKIQVKSAAADQKSPVHALYLSCFQELKTAVVVFGNEEFHLVAMPTRVEKFPCLWCYSIPTGIYNSCLSLLNMRCLAIVFDLDETLIVANTMKSFEDRIEALSHRIDAEDDPIRISGMSAELKRYLEDKDLLKQYKENDSVLDNGKLVTFQNEEVPPLSTNHYPIVRPIIRLPEKQLVLTRINPEIRDTSVLVRFRPAWEDLRSYLTAKGRKRFEVYVCTMAERDYALEMWRLLDPEACLISSKQLSERIVCVKSGSRKSLLNVFQVGCCLPKMSMVIDDRLNVWDDKDQHRVHVVPAFAPYYAPQAETANAVPVLCVARNVACNVRGGFFREFDENFLRRIFELYYENDIVDIPIPPDASDYLLSEDTGVAHNGTRDLPIFEGRGCVEIEKRSSQPTMSIGEQSGPQAPLTRIPLPDEDVSQYQTSANSQNACTVDGSVTAVPSSLCGVVLQEIGKWCGSKVDFRYTINSNKDVPFSVEVLFDDEKVGVGMGRTRKEAQLHAAAAGLRYLANHYIAYVGLGNGDIESSLSSFTLGKENGFLADDTIPTLNVLPKEEKLPVAAMPEHSLSKDNPQRLSSLTLEIKELLQHLGENVNVVFQEQPPTSMILNKGEYYFQLEIPGQILGKGICYSKEGAMLQAAEDAVQNLKKQLNFSTLKSTHTSSLSQCGSPKRPKR